jgi:hypothetical protein
LCSGERFKVTVPASRSALEVSLTSPTDKPAASRAWHFHSEASLALKEMAPETG